MRLTKPYAAIAVLCCAVALTVQQHDFAAAQSQENLRKLSETYKLIQDDETAKAVEQLNALLEEAPEDAATASMTLLLRGQAYAKAGRPAQALSDFNAALWLQGLNASQRKDAVAGRQAALAELGLAEQDAAPSTAQASDPTQTASIPTSIPTSTSDDAPAPQPAPTPQPTASAEPQQQPTREQPTTAWQTEVETARAEPEQTSGIESFFSNLFGGSDTQETKPPRETETAAVSGWTANTTDATAARAPAASDGRMFRVQLASVGTREGAESEVRRLSRLLGDALEGETPSIQRTDTDAGNTYFRIVVGPKPSRDTASSMCESFKARGVDCLVVSSR